MEDNNKPHDIFNTNPTELLSFIDQYLKINLNNGECLKGKVYTIDPVTQSVILVNRENGNLSVKIVMKHSIASMEIISEVSKDQQNIVTKDIFTPLKSTSNQNSKEDVKKWLEKNMIPVIEDGDKLLFDSLEISPPYGVDQCYSSNPIVMSRIQALLRQMPSKNS